MLLNFHNINWGPDEAKGDNNLAHYFMKIPDYEKVINGDKRYVIGRKGTGKTALLEKIRLEALSNDIFQVKDLTLRDFPLSDIIGLRDKSMQDKSQYVPIWSFLIVVELCKLIINDIRAGNYYIKDEIGSFLKANKLDVSGGFVETLNFLSQKEAKVNINTGLVNFEGKVAGGSGYNVAVHFSKAIAPLKSLVSKITSTSSYFILFDELDEGYSAGDKNKRLLLLSLFRAIENLAIEFKKTGVAFRPLMALRSDIFDNLEDNDLNKYDDYIVRLNWQAGSSFNYSIRELVNNRIKYAFPLITNNPWETVVDDYDIRVPGPKKSVWRYVYTRTFERPRDIIKFLKFCGEANKTGKLTITDVLNAESNYSNWFYREVKDEISSFLPVWKESIAALQQIGKGVLTTNELEDVLMKDVSIANYLKENNKGVEHIVTTLFEFSIIGNLDENNRWLFRYKDEDLVYNSSRRVSIHFGFEKKLRIK